MAKKRALAVVKDGEKVREKAKVVRGALDLVLESFEDLGKNRLPVWLTDLIHSGKQVIIAAIRKREELRGELVKQYDETGEGWKDAKDAPPELVQKIMEMTVSEVELDFGKPIELPEELKKTVLIDSTHYSVLKEIGFLA